MPAARRGLAQQNCKSAVPHLLREHAQQGGFPANRVSEIKTVISPTTAE